MELGCSGFLSVFHLLVSAERFRSENLAGSEGMLMAAAKGSPQPKLLAQFLGQNVTQMGEHGSLHLLELRTAKSESLLC